MGEEVRLREPDRKQLILETVDYEKLVGAEHPVRAIWRVLEGLDLSRFCAPIKAREHGPGIGVENCKAALKRVTL